jgi:hypothetical protein
MFKKVFVGLAIASVLAATPFALAVLSPQAKAACCSCCGDACACEVCVCDANGCACDAGGDCVSTTNCCDK